MQCSFVSGANWNAIYVQHGDGSVSWYGHMKSGSLTNKGVGASVVSGEILGKVGSSGQSTGPHLHFEVYDSHNNLVDPYAGNCNSLNVVSWWVTQKPYFNTEINAIMTHRAPPQFNTCPTLSDINDTNHFAINDIIYFAIYLKDQEIGANANLALYDPSGTLYYSWSKSFTNNYYSSYWYWQLSNLAINGEWTFEVELLGEVVSHNFNIGFVTGIKSTIKSKIAVFPNPFKNKIRIEGLSKTDYKNQIYLLDVTGREVFSTIVLGEVDLPESIELGVYLLRIVDKNGKEVLSKQMIKTQ